MLESNEQAIGWVNFHPFDFKGELASGNVSLLLWPMNGVQEANPIGTSVENIEGHHSAIKLTVGFVPRRTPLFHR